MNELTSGASWSAWTDALQRFLGGSESERARQRCPNCESTALRLKYGVREGSDVGYLMFWCDVCLEGIYGSRAAVPPGAETVPTGLPPEERRRLVPDYLIVPPEDDDSDDPDVESAIL